MMLGMVNSAPELYLTDFGKAGFSGKNDKNPEKSRFTRREETKTRPRLPCWS
jgi:hypothetical protein